MRKCKADNVRWARGSNKAAIVESFDPDVTLTAAGAGEADIGASASAASNIQVAGTADRIGDKTNRTARTTTTAGIACVANAAPGSDRSADRNAAGAGDKNCAAAAAGRAASI